MERHTNESSFDEIGRHETVSSNVEHNGNSSGFILNTDGWIAIDEGSGDRYHHAQNNYLDKPIIDDNGIWRYKYEGDTVVERTAEEIEEDIAAIPKPMDINEEQDEAILELTYELTLMQLGMEV